MKRIAVLSDTHDILLPEVVKHVSECDGLIHAGDFTKPEILDVLRQKGAVYVVRGNNDRDWAAHLRKQLIFTIEGVNIGVAHMEKDLPRDRSNLDLLICGHTHSWQCELRDGKQFLNPGCAGRHRFHLLSTMAVLTLDQGKLQIEKIELK